MISSYPPNCLPPAPIIGDQETMASWLYQPNLVPRPFPPPGFWLLVVYTIGRGKAWKIHYVRGCQTEGRCTGGGAQLLWLTNFTLFNLKSIYQTNCIDTIFWTFWPQVLEQSITRNVFIGHCPSCLPIKVKFVCHWRYAASISHS